MAIEAVIWDFGGVFTTSPFEAFNRYEAAKGLPKDLIRTVNATNPHENAWALFERAEIDRDGFDMKFLEESTALGHPVRGADVLPLLSGDVRPRMVEALKLCKQHFKVGCITNNMAQGHGPGMAATPEARLARGRHHGAVRRGHRKLEGRRAQARPAHLPDGLRADRRRPDRLRLPRRPGHQLQAGRRARHEGDQGGERGPGAGRPRRRAPA